jgi:hypothetical protein
MPSWRGGAIPELAKIPLNGQSSVSSIDDTHVIDTIIVSHGGVMKQLVNLYGGTSPKPNNLDGILFRIDKGAVIGVYFWPTLVRKPATELGLAEIDKRCMKHQCMNNMAGGRRRKSRRRQRRGRGRP